jgi:hypothetical protein
MAQLATCPGCTSQLALPEGATLSDCVRCPRCGHQFPLMESVQFSIPTAELITEVETEERQHRSSLQPVPGAETYEPYAAESFEPPSDPDETETVPFPASATLSDWEARLRRAIAAEPEATAEPAEESYAVEKPTISEKFSLPDYAALKTDLDTKPTSAEPDFAVPDADLAPTASFPSRETLESWSAEDAYAPESLDAADGEPTVKTSFDATLTDAEGLPPVVSVDTASDSPFRKKRKRSIVRTLASASLGVVGIPLGLYVLLWLRGPAGDMLHIAEYLPSFMLPSSFEELHDDTNSQALVAEDLEPEADTLVEEMAEELPENDTATPLAEAEPKTILDDPDVEPATATAPAPTEVDYQGPKFELVEPAEFNALFAAAQQAVPALEEGDLNSKESVAKKGQAYMTFAKLAEKFSYINQPGQTLDQSAQAALAQQLIRTTLRKDAVKRDLPQIALRWWQYPERPSIGMVLIGKIERLDTTDAGNVAIASLGIDGVAPSIPILLGNTEHQEGDIVGVVGTIMVNPAEQLGEVDPGLGPLLISQYSFPLELFANIPTPTDEISPTAERITSPTP